MMKAKYFHVFHWWSVIISCIALTLSIIAAVLFFRKGEWMYFVKSIVSAILQLASIGQIFIWSSNVGIFEDEEDLLYDHTSTPYVIGIAVINLYSVYLIFYALKT